MSELFDLFQQALSAATPDYCTLAHTLKTRQKKLSGFELVQSNSLLRLSLALQQWSEGNAGIGNSDIAILIRQVIRNYKQRLSIPVQLWHAIHTDETSASLRATGVVENNLLQLNADDWYPDWLTQTAEIDDLQPRRSDISVVGDGLLFTMSNGSFTHYQSLAQKVAVQACFFAPPGSTLLVALPTGGGKSLTVQLPAWYESAGGTIKGGTTIVVVPTVSLALDQERRIRQFFSSTVAPEYEPYSWTGSTSAETKAIIRRGITDGTLPVLYVSPEALLQSALYHICLEAARRKTLRRFVIDEVHLVETWGAGFRTEFQLLAAYQKLLLEHSQGQLRTLLLSATISRSCAELLKQLFGEDENYYTICSNRLRAEPAYWFRFSQHNSRREQRVLAALQYLPRPLILYVATPSEAKDWETRLKENGFQRCATFTGETHADKRQQLIDAWNNDEIDIMVATSAFGVGIDKRNVRTILHACLPENLDRFYQEVGRAGRDGYSAVSLVCTTIHDHQAALDRISKARITTGQAAKRWEGMRKTALFPFNGIGDILLVDTNAPPEGLPDMRRSNANKEWNNHTLLLMQRACLLEIMDPREAMASANVTFESGDWLQIHLLFQIRPLDVERLLQHPEWADLYAHLRPEYFLYRLQSHAEIVKARLSRFEVEWLWVLELSMLVATAVTTSCSLQEAARVVSSQRSSLAKRTMDVIFQSQQIDTEEKEKTGRLQDKLQEFINTPELVRSLEYCETVLWAEHSQDLSHWLQQCYASSLGHTLFATLTHLISDIDPDDLVMDVDGNSIWISETVPGGIGIISQLTRIFESNARDFDRQMQRTLRHCNRQEISSQLQMIAELVKQGDRDLQIAFVKMGID